jgi:hypothetical protein
MKSNFKTLMIKIMTFIKRAQNPRLVVHWIFPDMHPVAGISRVPDGRA